MSQARQLIESDEKSELLDTGLSFYTGQEMQDGMVAGVDDLHGGSYYAVIAHAGKDHSTVAFQNSGGNIAKHDVHTYQIQPVSDADVQADVLGGLHKAAAYVLDRQKVLAAMRKK